MMAMYYIGIVDGKDDVWGLRIPDCPGAYGGGPTAEAAIADGTSALAAWAEATLKAKREMPAPRTLAEIVASGDDVPDTSAGEAVVMVPLLLDSGRTVRANVSFDAGFLAVIDAEAARRGVTRAAFLASAAREKIIQAR